jgi:hypothetical protein
MKKQNVLWRQPLADVTKRGSLWRQPLADVTKRGSLWRPLTSQKEVLYDVSHWLTSQKEVVYDVSQWLTSQKEVLFDVSQWLRDTVKKHKFQTKGIIPLLKCRILFCSRFLTQGRMFTNDTAILVERMLEWNSGFIVFKRHSFCSIFRGETSYSHVHHAENMTRGMSFLDARIRESRWQ